MNYRKPMSRKLHEARDNMLRKVLKHISKYEEYKNSPEDAGFATETKLIEMIKRELMVVNHLAGIEKAVKDEEATINGAPADVDEGTRYEEERLEAARQKLAQLGLKVVA
jgi:hypothetical protein